VQRVTLTATFLDRLIDERANEANQDSISYVTAGTTAYCVPCDAFAWGWLWRLKACANTCVGPNLICVKLHCRC
jgi:hypothetical protein